MLTENDLRELLNFKVTNPVLSVYLNTDPTEGNADSYMLNLRTMLKNIKLPDDVSAVEHYFDREFDWSGKSVAVFSCAPQKFFRAYPIAIPVRNRVRINDHPHVKPLADLLSFYGGYGVALVDKQGARLFYFHLGELREQEGIIGETVRHTKRGGASAVAGRRGGVAGQTNYNEELTERNMRDAVEFSSNFFAENNVRRVLIGGTDANAAMFRSMLPKSWQSLIVGTFPISMNASKDEVLERALEIGHQVELRQEEGLLNTVITNAAKKRGGVVKLDATLKAVHEGRVQTLIIREGFRAPGYRCLGCGYVGAEQESVCPFCGNKQEKIPDAVELAVHQVMQNGGEVEVLHQQLKNDSFGNIGAILRY